MINVSPGPIGKTAIILVGGTVVGLVLGAGVMAANRAGSKIGEGEEPADTIEERSKVGGFLAGAAALGAVAFIVTGSVRTSAVVVAGSAAIGLGGRELERRGIATPGTVAIGGLVAQTVATYLAVR